jgi:hypothetical protein
MKELTQPVIEFMENYRCNWKIHVHRMSHSRITLQAERRSLGRPSKRRKYIVRHLEYSRRGKLMMTVGEETQKGGYSLRSHVDCHVVRVKPVTVGQWCL